MLIAVTWVQFSAAFVHLSVLPHGISETDAARITKLVIEMPHHDPGNPYI